MTAEWEHFFPWLRADDEKEKIDREAIKKEGHKPGGAYRRSFPPQRLLDYVENFILYYQDNEQDHRPEPPVHRRQSSVRYRSFAARS